MCPHMLTFTTGLPDVIHVICVLAQCVILNTNRRKKQGRLQNKEPYSTFIDGDAIHYSACSGTSQVIDERGVSLSVQNTTSYGTYTPRFVTI